MKLNISDYKTLVFDCDGVVLNSNKVKTDAFYKTALPYGEQAAEAMVRYHLSNGGVSRYKKLAYFLEVIVGKYSELELQQSLDNYASHVRSGLLSCEVVEGLEELRDNTSGIPWLIVSGGDQTELREIFQQLGIKYLFDGGIFGSPDDKETILARELASGKIKQPAIFLGDSKYDYKAALSSSLEFLFLTGWTEVAEWQKWVDNLNINYCESIDTLNKEFSKPRWFSDDHQ